MFRWSARITAFVLILALLGCTSTETALNVKRDTPPASLEDLQVNSPLIDFLGFDSSDGLKIAEEMERIEKQATAECMKQAGFDYIPPPVQPIVFQDFSPDDPPYFSQEWVEMYGFGVTTRFFDQSRVGSELIGLPDPEPQPPVVDPNQDYIDSLSQEARLEYSIALVGDVAAAVLPQANGSPTGSMPQPINESPFPLDEEGNPIIERDEDGNIIPPALPPSDPGDENAPPPQMPPSDPNDENAPPPFPPSDPNEENAPPPFPPSDPEDENAPPPQFPPTGGEPAMTIGGCTAEGLEAAQASQRGGYLKEFGEQIAQLTIRAQNDPRVLELRRSVSRCVADRGFNWVDLDAFRSEMMGELIPMQMGFGDLDEAQLARLGQLQQEELDLALAVISCGGGPVNEQYLLGNISAELEAKFIEENREALQKYANN